MRARSSAGVACCVAGVLDAPPAPCPWERPHLALGYLPFHRLLGSACTYLVEDCLHLHLLQVCVCGFLSFRLPGVGVRGAVISTSGLRGCFPFLPFLEAFVKNWLL